MRERLVEGTAKVGAAPVDLGVLPSVADPEGGLAVIQAMLEDPDVPAGVKQRLLGDLPKFYAEQRARQKLVEESAEPDEFESKILRMRGEAV